MQEIKLTIPRFGYRIKTRKWTVNRDIAPNILTVAKQQKISYAVRNDNDVTVTKHVIVCSFCGKETPAYANFIRRDKESFKSKTQIEIERWASRQLSFFGEQPQVISFNDPVEKPERFLCPHCRAVLFPGKNKFDVIIRTEKSKIKILRKLDFDDYFSVSWIKEFKTSEFDLHETITFNLGNGHTYVSLENEAGIKYAVRDISNNDITNMYDDPIFELIRIYKPVYRELKRFFRKFWNGTLPFSPLELDLEKYILLTKFVGFDRNFYNALPFSNTGSCIERSFAGAAKRLHNANNVPTLFEASQLPNIKTVRRIIFSNPALLLYKKELEAFWRILNDPNFFRTFLASRNLYIELSILHKYPSMANFCEEFTAAVGQRALYKGIFKNNKLLHSYALKYLLLNDHEKKMERKKWSGSFFSKMDYYDAKIFNSAFSVPIPPQNKSADTLECRINGYSFTRLCNSKEYIAAGTELQNCLIDWEVFNGNVYGVLKDSKYVAAIEIKNGVIIQAYTYRNIEMYSNRPLFSAFSIWKKRCGVKEVEADSDDNLPF